MREASVLRTEDIMLRFLPTLADRNWLTAEQGNALRPTLTQPLTQIPLNGQTHQAVGCALIVARD
jgi:hypothetical protein